MDGLSIIVPAYNEAGNIKAALQGVYGAALNAGLRTFEVVVVDDGSADDTWAVLTALDTLYLRRIRMVRHVENRGLRAAYETGLSEARYDRVTWVPGDGEIATESLAAIFRAIGTADLVVPFHGTPHLRPWFRRALTWISTTEMNVLFGHRLRYYQGPVVYPVALARSLPRTIPGFFCMAEMLLTALELGYSYVEVPLTHQERTYGVSKAVSWARIWHAQLAVLRFFWRLKVRRHVVGLRPQTEAVPA